MNFPELFHYANMMWLFFALYFLSKYRPVQVKREALASIFSLERICLLFGVGLVFFPQLHVSILTIPLHKNYRLALAGFVVVVLGLAFSAWARDVLGRNWSGRVIIQSQHELVTSGPYAYVRHPLYSGIIVAMAGTTLIVADAAALAGFFFVLVFALLKAAREERLLEAEFGSAYLSYRAHTGGLLPRIAHI